MSSTESEAPKSAVSRSLVCGESSPRNGITVARVRKFSFGYARSSCSVMVVSSAAGLLDRDAGFELGDHLQVVVRCDRSKSAARKRKGLQAWVVRLGNTKSGGITPMTV